jgi:tetratricopeptide (TPR) repeat protein
MAIQREQVVQAAEKLVSRGKIEAAIREYKKVLAENPNDANTLNRVGDLYARIQRIDEAVDFFNQIAAQYTAEGFFVKAIAIYKKIIKLNPTHLEVYERLAELYHKQGLTNEARTQYQVLADYYLKHENPTSAIAMYQKMAEVEPENPTYHVKLAELYHQQRLTEKAMGEYRTIAELMIGHGHAQEAAQVYERALDVDATNIPFITDAVLKLREAGHGAAAARFLAAAVERNPQAARVSQLVGAEEEEAAPATAEIAPAPTAAPAVSRVPQPPPVLEEEKPSFPSAPPEPSVRESVASWTPGGLGMPSELFDSQPISLPEVAEMAEGVRASQVDFGAPAGAAAPPEEFDLDLDEVFVLDMESEEEPASLVKPPADMLGEAPRRPAWAQAADEGPGAATLPGEIHSGSADDFALSGIAAGFAELEEAAPPPPALPELAPAPPEPEFELDLDAGFDLDSLASELAPPPVAEPAAPAAERGFELSDGRELDDALELEPLPDLPPLEPEPPPGASRETSIEIDTDLLEQTAAELHLQPPVHQREEDLVTEAEMLAKYGLEEKALERVREALQVNPRHLPAYALAIQIHLDKGRHARVGELANQMAKAASEVTNRDPWLKLRRRLLTAGYRLDGDQVLAGPVPAAAPQQEVDQLLRGLLGREAPKKPAARREPAAPVSAPTAPAVPPPPSPTTSPTIAAPRATPATPAPVPPPVAVAPPAPPPPLSPQASAPIAPGQHFNLLEIGEMVENEDLEAFDGLPAGPPIPPPPPAAAPPPFAPPPPPPSAAPPRSAAAPLGPGLDDTGMSWLDEAEAGRSRKEKGGGRLFAEEDDFFDLAGELEQELSREEGLRTGDLLVQPAEQSLEQIVEGFKKGVAENLSPTDFDTHFNLGIAYREMGLLDEAIGEFQLASKSPHLLVPCCSMLGLCFLDKGLPELAIKWYRRGLEAPNLSEDDSLGLLYDMGNVYETLGDVEAAYKTFVEIYGINTNYRDVVARIEELGRGR